MPSWPRLAQKHRLKLRRMETLPPHLAKQTLDGLAWCRSYLLIDFILIRIHVTPLKQAVVCVLEMQRWQGTGSGEQRGEGQGRWDAWVFGLGPAHRPRRLPGAQWDR